MLALVLAIDGGSEYRANPYYEESIELEVVEGPPTGPYENPDAGMYEVESAKRYDGGVLPDGWWLSPYRLDAVGADLRGCERDLWMALEADARREEAERATRASAGPTFSLFSGNFASGLAVGLGAGLVVGAGTVLLLTR